jgi:hypothetical protein
MLSRSICCAALLMMLSGCGEGDEDRSAVPPQDAAQQPAVDPAKADTPEGKAQALLEQLRQQIHEQKWSQADATVAQLEAMKPTLNEALREEINNARGSLGAAKDIAGQMGQGQR